MIQKIDLVFPKNDKEYEDLVSGYTTFPPPSGLEIISAYINSFMPKAKIRIYDGQQYSLTDLEDELKGDYIGISDWFSNHKNSMELAKKVKEKNPSSKIIVGGPNASNLGKRILNNHSYIDYIVKGDGEKTLLGIIQKKAEREIPNLYYRNQEGKVEFSFNENIRLNDIPNFNFEHLVKSNLKKYDSRRPDYFDDLNRTPIPISSIRGCIKAASKIGKCSYCNIPTKSIRILSPKRFWEQIKLLNQLYGINSFFETGDDFIVGNYPSNLLKAKPNDLKINIRTYTQPDKINSKMAEILKKIGVNEIFMGIENINPEILIRANKFYDVSKVEDSIKNCQEQGINVFLPFLFGLSGETEETAKRNHEFAHHLSRKYNNVSRVLYSLAVPIIGSSWFEDMKGDNWIVHQYPDICWEDNLDYPKLTELSIQRNCSVKLKDLLEIINNPPNLKKERIASYGDMAHKIGNS